MFRFEGGFSNLTSQFERESKLEFYGLSSAIWAITRRLAAVGGDKKSQRKDIKVAQGYWAEYSKEGTDGKA